MRILPPIACFAVSLQPSTNKHVDRNVDNERENIGMVSGKRCLQIAHRGQPVDNGRDEDQSENQLSVDSVGELS